MSAKDNQEENAGYLRGLEKATQIAEEIKIDRFGKLERYQVADAIRDHAKEGPNVEK